MYAPRWHESANYGIPWIHTPPGVGSKHNLTTRAQRANALLPTSKDPGVIVIMEQSKCYRTCGYCHSDVRIELENKSRHIDRRYRTRAPFGCPSAYNVKTRKHLSLYSPIGFAPEDIPGYKCGRHDRPEVVRSPTPTCWSNWRCPGI
jgi:hypothetical protein